MRFSLTTMILLMALILILGIVTWEHVSKNRNASGQSLVIVMIDGSGINGLDRRLDEAASPAISSLREKGVTLQNCIAPSPWYPSAAASLLTGRYPSEHGLTMTHAHLTLKAKTLAEECAASGFRTCAFIEADSLLACTGILQGFQRIIDYEGRDVAVGGMRYITRHVGNAPLLGLIEINAERCGGLEGIEAVLKYVTDELAEEDFFEDGTLVVCTPGGWDRGRGDADPTGADLKQDPMREFFVLKGETLTVAKGLVLEKPVSLSEMNTILRSLTWGGTFHLRDCVRTGRISATEMALSLSSPKMCRGSGPAPHVCRLAWFDDLPFRCYVSSDGSFEFQGADLRPVEISPSDESLVRSRYEAFTVGWDRIDDLNIEQTAGPVIDGALAERLSGPWSEESYLGHHLHAVEHYRMGHNLMREGFPALAVNEFRSALSVDPDYAEALFHLANAYASFGRETALPYFRSYLDRFGLAEGQEDHIAEARRFLHMQ